MAKFICINILLILFLSREISSDINCLCCTTTYDKTGAVSSVCGPGWIVCRDPPKEIPQCLVSQLNSLDASGNAIENISLPANVYPNLTKLILDSNRIKTIVPLTFSKWNPKNMLSELSLAKNNINQISGLSFKGLSKLTTLNLAGNRIQEFFDYTFVELTSLANLSLAQNYIHRFTRLSFANCTTLKYLDVSYGRLTELSGGLHFLEQLENLEVLHLSHNHITRIETDMFHNLLKMRDLYLDYNHITTIEPNAFLNLNGLKVLDLRRLDYQDGTKLDPKLFNGLLNLYELDLSDASYLTSLGTTNSLLPWNVAEKLGLLRLCNMTLLTRLGERTLEGMSKLIHLEVCNNTRLTSLPDNFIQPSVQDSVLELYLYGNALDTLDWASLPFGGSRARTFKCDLTGNRWACDCRNQLLPVIMRWADNCNELNKDKRVQCASPKKYANTSVLGVDKTAWTTCPPNWGKVAGFRMFRVLLFLFIGFFLGALLIFAYYRLRKSPMFLKHSSWPPWRKHNNHLELATSEEIEAEQRGMASYHASSSEPEQTSNSEKGSAATSMESAANGLKGKESSAEEVHLNLAGGGFGGITTPAPEMQAQSKEKEAHATPVRASAHRAGYIHLPLTQQSADGKRALIVVHE